MSSNLDVKITAEITDLQQKFAVARAETSSLGSEMNKLAKEAAAGTLDTAGQSQFAQLAEQYLQAKTQAASFSAQMKESGDASKSFGESIEEAKGQLSGLFMATGAAAAYEAIERVGEAILSMGERSQQVLNTADVLGVTTAQYQAMAAAAEAAGVGDQQLMQGNERLVAALREARDGSGEAIAKLHDLGITNEMLSDKSVGLDEALAVIGPRLRDGASHATEMAAATALLGARAVLVAKAWQEFDASAKGVAQTNDRLNATLKEQDETLAAQGTALSEVWTWFKNTTEKTVLYGEAIALMSGGSEEAFAKLVRGSAQADAAMKALTAGGGGQQLADLTVSAQRRMTTAVLQGEEDQIQATAAGTAKRLALAQEYYTDSLRFYNNNASVSQVREAHSQLISETRSYNANQLRMDDELQAGELALQRQMNEMAKEKIELHKQMTAAATKDAESELAVQRESVLAQIGLQKQLIQSTQVGSGGGNQQAAAEEIALTAQELEVWERYYQAKAALANGDAALLNEIQTQRLAKEQELDGKILTIEKGTTKTAGQQWMSFANTMSNALDQAVRGMLTRNESFKQAFIKMSQQLSEGVISNLIKVGTEQAVQSATGLALQRSAQQQAVMMDARKAASGAYASASSVPYVGWILGPIAAAAAFAAVEGFSAEGGFDIPPGMNPMTQLHSREMVLPAKHADVIRGLADDGAAGGGGDVHQHFHLAAHDTRGLADLLKSPAMRQAMADAAKLHYNRGGR